MRAHRVDAPIVQNDNLIRLPDGAEPLGNDNLGHAGQRPARAVRIFPSVAVSTALVESSKISTLGCLSSVRAMHRRCFCPPGQVDAALAQIGIQPLGQI